MPRLLALCQDVTAFKRAQRDLLSQERQFRQILDRAPVAIGITREDHVSYANEALVAMHRLGSFEEAVGAPMGAWVAPEERDAFVDRARKQMAGHATPSTYETVGLRTDGSRFPVLVTASMVRLSAGRLQLSEEAQENSGMTRPALRRWPPPVMAWGRRDRTGSECATARRRTPLPV